MMVKITGNFVVSLDCKKCLEDWNVVRVMNSLKIPYGNEKKLQSIKGEFRTNQLIKWKFLRK